MVKCKQTQNWTRGKLDNVKPDKIELNICKNVGKIREKSILTIINRKFNSPLQ